MRIGKRTALILAATAVAGMVQVSRGATATWNGADSFWNAPNWDNSGPYTPVSGDALNFGTNGVTSTRNDFVAGSFSGLTFLTGAQSFTLDGNDIALTGPLTVNSANGNTSTINFGITAATALNFGADQSGNNNLTLNGNVTASALSVTSQSTTADTLTIGAGKVLTINGNMNVGSVAAAGTLRANMVISGNELDVNGSVFVSKASTSGSSRNVATLSLGGLSTFKVNAPSGGTFGVGVESQAVGTVTLANTLNQIAAGTIAVGWAGNSNNGTSELMLGAGSNVLNTGTLVAGRGKGVGTIAFANSTGSVTIAGFAGGASTTNITIGSADSATAATGVCALLLAGHQATVQGGTVIVGQQTGSNGNTSGISGTGNVTFDTGNFSANTFQLANATGTTGTNGATGTFTLGTDSNSTGSFNVNTAFSIGNLTNANAGAKINSAFIINGGTANINANITLTNTTPSNVATATITLNGGTLNMMGHQIGGTPIANTTLNMVMPSGGQTATIQNLGGSGINGADLNMNGGGMLILDGANTYSGTTIVSSGTLSPTATATIASTVFEVRNGGNLDLRQVTSPQIPAGKTISGNGTVLGNTTVAGIVAPGNNTVPGSTAGTLTFANNLTLAGGGTLNFELSNDVNGTNDAIVVNGNLSLSGTTVMKASALSGGFTTGAYTVMTYGSMSGTGTITAPGQGLTTRRTFSLNFGANSATLSVGGNPSASLNWLGDGGANLWDHSATNWNNGGSNDKFFDLDTVTFDDSGLANPTVNLSGALVPAAVIVNTSGTYTLAGTGSLTTDNFAVNTGTIVIAADSVSSGSTTIASGAALQIGAGTTSGGAGLLSNLVNNGTLVADHSDTLVVSGNITGTGATQILSGTLQLGAGGATGSLASGTISNASTLAFNHNNAYSIANLIEGTGAVFKNGSGTLTLTGSSTYTGPTFINAGVLKPGNLSAFGSTSNVQSVTVASGAAIDLNSGAAGDALNFGSIVFHISGTGVGGTGAIINGGTTRQFSAFQFITLDSDATIGGFRFDIGRNGTNNLLDLGQHRLTVAMTGTQPMFGIEQNATVTSGTIEVASGALDIERTSTVLSDGLGSNIIFDPGTNLQAYEIASGQLTRPLVFMGGNLIGAGSANASFIDSPIELRGNVTLQAQSNGIGNTNGTGTLMLDGSITENGGSFGITKVGPNQTQLAGTNTYTGGTTVNAGTLLTSTNFSNGTLTVTGGNAKVAQMPTSDSAAGLTVVPAVSVSGTGSIDLTNNAMIVRHAHGDSTTLASIQSAIVSGYAGGAWNGLGINSSSAGGSPSGAGKTALGYAEASAVGISNFAGADTTDSVLVAYTLAGDANLDLKVNALDFNALASNYGLTGTALWQQGDFNYDGVVDTNDFTLLSQNFLQPLASPALSPSLGTLVPEPTSLALIALGGLVAVRRRRSR